MNVTVEDLGPCKKLVRIELETQKVDAGFDEATKQFQRVASLPGFRPGKAPKDMVVKRFERDIAEEVKTKLTREAYQNALKEKKLQVVRLQDIEEVQFSRGQPYQFIATVETAPEFEIPEYKGIPIKRQDVKVTDADVNRALNMLRDREAKFETVQRELRDNDVAVVNYKATCDGKPLTDIAPAARGLTEKTNFWIDMRKDAFIPGFTDQLQGAKAGDKRTVNVDFPKDFVSPALAEKKGVYEVEVVEVKQRNAPELNDEFAKKYGAETLQALREGIRQDLQNEANSKQKNSLREQVVKALIDKMQCDLPESFVQQETRSLVYNIVDENTRRGVPKETLDEQKEQIYSTASFVAKERVKATFLYHRIAEKEGIRIDQQEMMQRIQMMAAQYQMTPDKLIKELQKNNGFDEIHEQMLSEKVVELLLQNAKVEDVPAEAAPTA